MNSECDVSAVFLIFTINCTVVPSNLSVSMCESSLVTCHFSSQAELIDLFLFSLLFLLTFAASASQATANEDSRVSNESKKEQTSYYGVNPQSCRKRGGVYLTY